MNLEELEKRVNRAGNISFWRDGIKLYKQCSKCKEIKLMEEYNKAKKEKDGKRNICKGCEKQYRENNKEKIKQYRENNKEKIKECNKRYKEKNKERLKEYSLQYYQSNKERKKEYKKQYREANKEYIKECRKQHYENNKEHYKQYYRNNKEYIKEYKKEHGKQYRKNIRENNLQYITNILEQINPKFKQLNLPIYGIIYKITNKLNNRCYIGQTIQSLKERYPGNIIKAWIEERVNCDNQKFKDDLIEENFTFDIIDVAASRWHLDKLEAHYINKYNSYENGYNNNTGFWSRDDGLEEFENILKENNLEFIDGELRRICDEK